MDNQLTAFRWNGRQWEDIAFKDARIGDIILLKDGDLVRSVSQVFEAPEQNEDGTYVFQADILLSTTMKEEEPVEEV